MGRAALPAAQVAGPAVLWKCPVAVAEAEALAEKFQVGVAEAEALAEKFQAGVAEVEALAEKFRADTELSGTKLFQAGAGAAREAAEGCRERCGELAGQLAEGRTDRAEPPRKVEELWQDAQAEGAARMRDLKAEADRREELQRTSPAAAGAAPAVFWKRTIGCAWSSSRRSWTSCISVSRCESHVQGL